MKIASGVIQDHGATIDSTTINQISNKITIFGDPGAILSIATQSPGPILTIQGQVNVEIHNLELEGATGSEPGQGDGIQLIPAIGSGDPAGGPILNLVHVTIDRNTEHGIHATAGVLSVTQSKIFDNDQGGVIVSDSATRAIITNSFIYGNGKDTANTGASTGGLMLLPIMSGQLQFDTIVDNNSSINQFAGGAICKTTSSDSSSVVSAAHNIMVKNTVNNNNNYTDNTQTNIAHFGDSLIRGNPPLSDLEFRNSLTDYHLLQGAKVIDVVTDTNTCANIGVDFDGDARPQGSGCDLGADEWVPLQNK